MVKVVFFVLLIVGVMFYPVFVSENIKQTNNEVQQKIKLPDIQFLNGNFLIYNKSLQKKGKFLTFDIYKKYYIFQKLEVKDIIKNEFYKSNKTIFKNDIVIGYNAFYKNSDYEITTNKAIYNKKTKILQGQKFKLLAENFNGIGKTFKVDNKKNLYATNIIYNIKVNK